MIVFHCFYVVIDAFFCVVLHSLCTQSIIIMHVTIQHDYLYASSNAALSDTQAKNYKFMKKQTTTRYDASTAAFVFRRPIGVATESEKAQ